MGFGGLLVTVAAAACGSDDSTSDELLDPTAGRTRENPSSRPSIDGGLPAPSSSSNGSKPTKDGGPSTDADGGSSGEAPECADPGDAPESVEEIEFPDAYVEVAETDRATKDLSGVVGDYFDYDYFGFDVYRNASGTVFPYAGGGTPFPADVEICMFVECLTGAMTSFSCDAGTAATDFSGHEGCCSVSGPVSLYYATCNGTTGDDAYVYVRVTPNDQEICSVPYAIRASFTQ